MRVLKFGGTSVGSPERIERLHSIVQKYYVEKGHFPIVVVSAFSGVTDQLINMARKASQNFEFASFLDSFKNRHFECLNALVPEGSNACMSDLIEGFQNLEDLLQSIFLLKELSTRSLDLLQSFGERSSARIIAAYFNSQGSKANYVDARKLIVTDNNFGYAAINIQETKEKIINAITGDEAIPIVTGFIAATADNITTTLGRGGSDYTASIFAACLEAEFLDIWTDVDGVLTSDPRKVSKAFCIEQMSYEEAMEMSHFGAKVIYAPTIRPVMQKNIPVRIKNSFNPDHRGTLISNLKEEDSNINPVRGITALSDMSIITLSGAGMQGIPGIAGRFFSCLGRAEVNIAMITQASSEHSISIAIKSQQIEEARSALSIEFDKEINRKSINAPTVDHDITLLAVVGDQMSSRPGVSGKLFSALGRNGVNVEAIAQGSSERNISLATKQQEESKALNVIHDTFFVSQSKTVNLFVVGLGLIGKTLMKQFSENLSKLNEESGIDIRIVGLANTRKMAFDEKGIDPGRWESSLSSGSESNIQAFVDHMISMNLPNTIFVDNTASSSLPALYEQVLSSSISISTPNKMAASSDYEFYSHLKSLARKHLVEFLYETNVGAALPVVGVIRDLIDSGDTINEIEAVLSGSMSFIFNSFKKGDSFSELVQLAKDKGYTEPDPRDDLNGMDVKRKITILTREAGFRIELDDVKYDPILPKELMEADSVEEFFNLLETQDKHFESLLIESDKKGERLRLIAGFADGKAVLKLRSVGPQSPFYNLMGSENMVVLRTKRYHEYPLIIRGPGAGAEVTAAGVFAEILEISRRKQ